MLILYRNNIEVGKYDSPEELYEVLQQELNRDNERFESNHYNIATYDTVTDD